MIAVEKSTTPKIGAHPNVPFEEYCWWEAVNWHTLSPFRQSALQGRHEMLLPPDATDDMVFGGAFHTAMLEPEKFDTTYVVMPYFEGHPNSNAYKARKSAWVEANSDKVHLTINEMAELRGMQRSVMQHPTASALLRGRGRNELSIVWRDKDSGELCKGRVDRLTRVSASVLDRTLTGDVICNVDLKKTSRFFDFDRTEITKYGYHGQLGFYNDGLLELEPTPITTLIVAVQDSPPFDVAVYNLTGDAIDNGRKLYRRLMRQLTHGKKTNQWPGICPTGTLPVILPKYAAELESEL